MKCPYCGKDNNQITDSRQRIDFYRRVRQCLSCGRSFKTREEVCLEPNRRGGPPKLSGTPMWLKRGHEEYLKFKENGGDLRERIKSRQQVSD